MKARLILIVLLSVLGWNGVYAKEAYVVSYVNYIYSSNENMYDVIRTLKFFYDDERTLHENETYHDYPYYEDETAYTHPEVYSINEESDYHEWKSSEYKDYHTVIEFDDSFEEYRPTSTKHWFDGVNIVKIVNIQNLNTSLVKDMSYMFAGCKEQTKTLKDAQFSTDFKTIFNQLNFSSVENLSHMVDSLKEIVIGNLKIPTGVNADGCFKSLKYLELTSKDIDLPDDFFNSSTTECAIVFPDGFNFGTDISTGHFTWKGGSFYGGICEPYAIFRTKGIDFITDCGSDEYFCQEYYLNLYYDRLKEKRIRDCKKEDSKIDYSTHNWNDDIYLFQSSQLCDWNKWDKQISFNNNVYWYWNVVDAAGVVPWEKPSLGVFWRSIHYYEEDEDVNYYYPFIHITIDPSCANYKDYSMPYGWFDFHCRNSIYGGYGEYSIFSTLPERCKDFKGLEYLHYDLYTINDTITYKGLEYTIETIVGDNINVKLFNNLTAKGDVVIPASIPDEKGNYHINVTTIGDNSFRNSTNLTSISIPTTVWNIGNYAFANCSNLTSVSIPASVWKIGDYSFSGCSNLSSVTVKWDDTIWPEEEVDREVNIFKDNIFEDNIFDSITYDNATLHVPMGCVEDYKNAPVWKNFKRIVSDNIIVDNIAAFKALDKDTRAQLTLNEAQVLHVSGYTAYVRDATGAINFQGDEDSFLTITAGQILNGFVIGKFTNYDNLPKFVWTNVTNANNITITNGTALPKSLTITEAKSETYYCDLIKIDGVKITSRKEGYSTKYYAYIGDNEIRISGYSIYSYGNLSYDDDGIYSVEGILIPPSSYEGNYTISLTQPLKSLNNEYALLSKDKCTLTFYYDNKQQTRSNDYITYTLNDNATSPAWLSEKETITKVVFDSSFADARPITTRYWFNNMANLNTIEGIEYLNTSEVTSMYSMFSGCSKLDILDLSTFDTSQTTSMTGMFNNCTSLKYLNLSGFNLSSATSIRLMFQNCTSLESVDLSSFDTSNVSDLRNLFYGCTSLTGLDLSMLEIADGAQTGNMFYDCKALKSLKISSTFGRINSNACTGVGTTSTPCRVYAPEGFSFGTDTSGESFKWKGGYFKLGVDPTISVGDVTAYTGVNAEASLSLTIGHDDYTGYQFDIVLPQGMSLVKTKSGFKYTLSSRFNGDGVSCAINQQNDGSYRAICYSTNHKTICGTEGVLITFPVVADETVAAGTYTGQIRNFTLNDIGNNSIHVPDVEFSLTVLDAATGDVNHDGCVDISDVLLTVDYILGKNPVNYIPSDGDINHDGEINISDVLSIVDIILGQNSYNAPVNARTSTVDDLTLLRKDNTYTLCLDNHEPYSGFQMQLSLPDGCTLRNASLVTDRSDGHRLTVRDHGDGTYTLIAYASDGRQLLDSGTPLLRLTINGTQGNDDVQMNNILFSTLQRETVLLPDVNGTATGMINIATNNNDTAPAYNIHGQRVSPYYRGLVISGGQKRIRK